MLQEVIGRLFMLSQRQADQSSLDIVERLLALLTLHLSITRLSDRIALDRLRASLASLKLDRIALVARLIPVERCCSRDNAETFQRSTAGGNPHVPEELLIARLKAIKLGIQRSLEHIGLRQDVSEGQRLLTNADRELMLLLQELVSHDGTDS